MDKTERVEGSPVASHTEWAWVRLTEDERWTKTEEREDGKDDREPCGWRGLTGS